MNDAELTEWKKRLRHSDNEWRNAGLIPDGKKGSTDRYSMMRFLDAYRGDFPAVLSGGAEPADQMAGNITFSIINTMVAQLSSRSPDPILRPVGKAAAEEPARRRAWLNEQLVEFMMTDRKFKKEADMALLCAVLTGWGAVRHGYTADVEFINDNGEIISRFKNQTPDLPWIQFVRPWQMRIDPMVNAFDPDSEPRWCAFHNLYFKNQIETNPNLIMRKDLKATHIQDIRLAEERKGAIGQGDPDAMAMYEEWVVYDADSRKFFGISPGSDKLIREERDWPFEWGQLPYSWLAFNEQIDTPFPIPFPRMFYDEQMLYNKIWTIINALVSRTRRIIFASTGGIGDEGQIALLKNPESLVEVIMTAGSPSEAVHETSFGTIDPQLIGLLYQLKEQIREVLGVSNFDRGQRANVETAAEANSISAGGQVARGRTQERFEAFYTNIIKTSHRAFLQSEESRSIVLPIIGKNNLDFLTAADRENGFIEVSLDDLQGEFSYDVKLDSTLRTDPNTELGRLATGFNLLGGTKSQLMNQRFYHERITELSGADPQQAVMSEKMVQILQAQQQAAEQQGQGGEAPAPDGVEASAQQGASGGLQAILGGAG